MRILIAAAAVAVAAATCAAPLLDPTHCCTLKSPPLWTAIWTTTAGTFELLVNRSAAPLGVDRFYNLVFYGYFQNASSGVPQPENKAGFFRVVPGFVVQFGIAGLPPVSAAWQNLNIKDDPVVLSNTVGTIAFATAGPDTRTTQVYINLGCVGGCGGPPPPLSRARAAHPTRVGGCGGPPPPLSRARAAHPTARPHPRTAHERTRATAFTCSDNSRLDKDGFAPFGVVTKGMAVVNMLYAGYGETPDQDKIYAQG